MMRYCFYSIGMGLLIGMAGIAAQTEESISEVTPMVHVPVSSREAEGRAKLLFEAINGSLQVMHRDFFDDDNAFAIPSRSLEDVFIELDKTHGVKLKWLTVNADTLNVDHDAETEFEKAAVKALSKGETVFKETTEKTFYYAGAISLRTECLKCHRRRRTSNEPRVSGLTIAIPIK